MSQIGHNGGPAFPVSDFSGDIGMSLRDWFAGQALAAMGEMICKSDSPDELMKRPERVAKWAFAHADAMLAEREKEERR